TLIAVDKQGNPVDDLASADIRLVDKGDEQNLQTFQPIPQPSPSSQDANLRHTVILIDDLNTAFADGVRVRSALAQAFPNGFSADDRVSIVRLASDVRLLLDFGQQAEGAASVVDAPPSAAQASFSALPIETRVSAVVRTFL